MWRIRGKAWTNIPSYGAFGLCNRCHNYFFPINTQVNAFIQIYFISHFVCIYHIWFFIFVCSILNRWIGHIEKLFSHTINKIVVWVCVGVDWNYRVPRHGFNSNQALRLLHKEKSLPEKWTQSLPQFSRVASPTYIFQNIFKAFQSCIFMYMDFQNFRITISCVLKKNYQDFRNR